MAEKWTFGTVLEKRGERVMYLAQDRDHPWGGYFIGIRLEGRIDTRSGHRVGDIANFAGGGWKVEGERRG